MLELLPSLVLTFWCCGGACLRSFSHYGALLRAMVVLASMCSTPMVVAAPKCPHCMDTIAACGGVDKCPLVTGVATNAVAMAAASVAKVPSLRELLPMELLSVFNRPVVEAITGLSALPVGGGEVDLASDAYKTAKSVIAAVTHGHVTLERGLDELGTRLEAATEALEVTKLTASIDLLSRASVTDYSGPSGYGVYTFIWAKCGAFYEAQLSGITKLPGAAVKSAATAAAELKAVIIRPKTQSQFYEMLHVWQMVIHALGLASMLVAGPFISRVVFEAVHYLGRSFEWASEFFLAHLRAIERDTSRVLNLANVVQRGNRDMYCMEADQGVATFFRTRGGEPQPGSANNGQSITWNGRFNKEGKKPCIAYNRGTAHDPKHLHPDGTCKFNHICMQWVTDKGPRGICGGAHPWGSKCDYPSDKRCEKPAKE